LLIAPGLRPAPGLAPPCLAIVKSAYFLNAVAKWFAGALGFFDRLGSIASNEERDIQGAGP